MITDVIEANQRAAELLAQVEVELLEKASATLGGAHHSGLALAVLNASDLVASARRTLNRARVLAAAGPEPEKGARRA